MKPITVAALMAKLDSVPPDLPVMIEINGKIRPAQHVCLHVVIGEVIIGE